MCVAGASALAPDGRSLAYESRDGKFFAQKLDASRLALPGANPHGCTQAAIFHFQEWKKLWESAAAGHASIEPLAPADMLDPNLAFSISTAGIRRLRF